MKETKFKQTEVGMIPSDWNVDVLARLTSRITVGIANSATQAYVEHGIPMLRNQNIKPNILDSEDVVYISSQFEERYKNKRLRKDDLIVARTGYPGTTCVVSEKFAGAQTFTTLIASPNNSVIASIYLSYYMNSDYGKAFFEASQIGGAQKNVNAHTLSTMPIPYPTSKKEQQRIANALSDVDTLINNLEKLIAKKKNIKQGAMQQLLTGKKRLPGFAPDERQKECHSERSAKREVEESSGYKMTELGLIPSDWDVKTISQVGKIIGGGTPSTFNSAYWNGSVQWFTPAELSKAGKYVSKSERTITKLGVENCSAKILPAGTILLTTRASIGTSAILKAPACTNQGFQSLVVNSENSNEFLYYLLSTKVDEMMSLASGSTFLEISPKKLGGIQLQIPSSRAEQTAIANVLSDMDTEISALETKLAKYRTLKTGMMQQLLTGKIRLV